MSIAPFGFTACFTAAQNSGSGSGISQSLQVVPYGGSVSSMSTEPGGRERSPVIPSDRKMPLSCIAHHVLPLRSRVSGVSPCCLGFAKLVFNAWLEWLYNSGGAAL